MGAFGRFRSTEGLEFPLGARVVVRSARGLEIGEVLATEAAVAADRADGTLLRRMADADELLAQRLEKNRDQAFLRCAELLAERGSGSLLIDVEHLFDGRGLYFYFLGTPDAIAEQLIAELAEAYDAEARIGAFADALETGCGPGCGTDEAENGCSSSGGCSTCAIAKACSANA
ncbi:hypothetical protein Pla111_30130 [Botrimarina hoheduenensis]|uniref:PSP1 C-terminal domain-containing protein n=2 Tax=Botrimarina hoheduenensis TaxID=2528000 RepID=A0A5C5VSM3_9BACT|nr:hypothetical protein Pla111_30130 [Botrimarina hoheduenensis]